MRISDWSSDVCSSDLQRVEIGAGRNPLAAALAVPQAEQLAEVTGIDHRQRQMRVLHAAVFQVDLHRPMPGHRCPPPAGLGRLDPNLVRSGRQAKPEAWTSL